MLPKTSCTQGSYQPALKKPFCTSYPRPATHTQGSSYQPVLIKPLSTFFPDDITGKHGSSYVITKTCSTHQIKLQVCQVSLLLKWGLHAGTIQQQAWPAVLNVLPVKTGKTVVPIPLLLGAVLGLRQWAQCLGKVCPRGAELGLLSPRQARGTGGFLFFTAGSFSWKEFMHAL